MQKYRKAFRSEEGTLPSLEEVAAWFSEDRRLYRFCGNKVIVWVVNHNPSPWSYEGKTIDCRLLLELANGAWGNLFIEGTYENAHIRVQFKGKSGQLNPIWCVGIYS
jgi:hypothetical protein